MIGEIAQKRLFRPVVLTSLVAGFLLSACVSILPDPKPADVIYRLKTTVETVTPQVDAPVIRIDRPTVSTALRGTDIVLFGVQTQITRASGAMWSDDVPTLIQRSLFDVMSSNEGLIGVLPNSGARPTYRISLNVRQFEADFDRGTDQAPNIISHYSVVLSDGASRKLIGTFDSKSMKRARTLQISEIVNAQSDVNQEALEAIAEWAERSLSAVETPGA